MKQSRSFFDSVLIIGLKWIFAPFLNWIGKCDFVEEIALQPLYNTIFEVQANFHVSYPNHIISRVKCIGCIRKGILNCHLGSSLDTCYYQNGVIMNWIIKRFGRNRRLTSKMTILNTVIPILMHFFTFFLCKSFIVYQSQAMSTT